MPRIDARIPVRFGAAAGEGDAVLAEDASWAASHVPGCACCTGRGGAALALSRLFQARARGEVAFFRRVLVTTASPGGEAAIRSALEADPLVRAWFRPDEGG